MDKKEAQHAVFKTTVRFILCLSILIIGLIIALPLALMLYAINASLWMAIPAALHLIILAVYFAWTAEGLSE